MLRRRQFRRWAGAIVAAAALTGLSAMVACADPGSRLDRAPAWQVIGTARTHALAEQDTIAVATVHGRFRTLMVRVLDREIQVFKLRITFASGETRELPFSGVLRAGSNSGVLDLAGHSPGIARVDVTYHAHRPLGGGATIELLGLR